MKHGFVYQSFIIQRVYFAGDVFPINISAVFRIFFIEPNVYNGKSSFGGIELSDNSLHFFLRRYFVRVGLSSLIFRLRKEYANSFLEQKTASRIP